MAKLFEAFTIKGKEVKNRIVLPPMVIFDKDIKGGMITDGVVEHYKSMAKAGCAIMIVEATAIEKNGLIQPLQLGIWDDTFIEGLSILPVIAHNKGALALIQLVHAGGKAAQADTDDIIAPSSCHFGENEARSVTLEDIERLKRFFVDAGIRAKKAGFDGVELHACHGYLMNQFLSPRFNKRDDIYGREKEKFVVDIIKQLRKEAGDAFIIAIRMPGNDPDLATSISYAKRFEEAGVDLFHMSVGFIPDLSDEEKSSNIAQSDISFKPGDLIYEKNDYYNWIVGAGIEIRRHISKPVIVVNGIRSPAQAHYILEQGGVDFVALGRGYLCDLDWIEKAMKDQPVRECASCRGKCLRTTGIYNCVLKK